MCSFCLSFGSGTEKTSWRGACRPCRRAGENWWSSWKVSWGCWGYETCWTTIWLFISLDMYENIICLLTFFLHLSLSHRCLSNASAFTHCHISSSGWQDEEQKQAVSVPLIQLCHSGVNMRGHSCKSLTWHMYCVWQNRMNGIFFPPSSGNNENATNILWNYFMTHLTTII